MKDNPFFEFLGILFENCGVFGSSAIETTAKKSNIQTVTHYVIELPLETGGTTYVNGVGQKISPNTLFFIKPGAIRYTVFPLRCFALHFKTNNPELIKIFDDIPFFIELQNRNKIYSCFLEMIQIFTNKSPHFEISYMNKFFEFIDLIIQDSSSTNNPFINTKLSGTAIKEAKNYIDTHYHEKISLEQLSNMVNLSPIYFQRVFTAITGKSPHKYLLDKKLQVAKELLLVSNYNLTEISNMCGFSSQSRFNIVFKQTEGMTPTEYKKKNRINNY